MRWFRHVRRLTSHQRPAEYTEKTEISAIHDTRVANVQCVGVMSDGDRQHFPLQLWQNHRSPWQRRARTGRSTTICRPSVAEIAHNGGRLLSQKYTWRMQMSRNVAPPGGVSVEKDSLVPQVHERNHHGSQIQAHELVHLRSMLGR